MLGEQPSLFQAHMARIADFLECGIGVWWHDEGDSLIFHDGYQQPNSRVEGPTIGHFRNSNICAEIERVKQTWIRCIDKFKAKSLVPPLSKVRIKENGKFRWMPVNLTPVEENENVNSTHLYALIS